MFGSRKNTKPEKCLKMPQNPQRPVHAVLGGLIFYYAFCSSAHDGARSCHAGTPRPDRRSGLGRGQWRDQSSAHRFLHERADPCLFGGGELLQRDGGRPQGAFVEVGRVTEAERRVPRFEFLRALEEADDLAVFGIRGHPVPGFRREGRRAGFDDSMEPLGHSAIRSLHLGDLREHGAFPVRLVRARAAARFRLQLLGALLHRSSFLVRESLGLLVGRGGALGGLLRGLLGGALTLAHENLLICDWWTTIRSRQDSSEFASHHTPFAGRNDNLLHLEHGLANPLRLFRVGVAYQLAQLRRDDLPPQPVFVLAPAAQGLFASASVVGALSCDPLDFTTLEPPKAASWAFQHRIAGRTPRSAAASR